MEPVIPSPEDPAFLRVAYDAVTQGSWRIVAALTLMLTVFLIRKYGLRRIQLTSWGAWSMAVLFGVTGAFANRLFAGYAFGGFTGVLQTAVDGAMTGLTAAGLWKGGKAFLDRKKERTSRAPTVS